MKNPSDTSSRGLLYRLWRAMFVTRRFMGAIGLLTVLFVVSYYYPTFMLLSEGGLILLIAFTVVDAYLLFTKKSSIRARRITPHRMSNGDENAVDILIENRYPFRVSVTVLDELPAQFQIRDAQYPMMLEAGKQQQIRYTLRPTRRGEYHFGNINLMACSPVALLERQIICQNEATVAVYPSFIQMRKYELLAISDRLTEAGIKKVRRIGHTMEFDQIREYVKGDDYRTINWKATARRRSVMVNHYQDEKAQQVYSLIDKGRVMKMPFDEMTLLDYAINASLVISNIAIRKQDKAGLVTFSNKIDGLLPAERRSGQMAKVLEMLYRQETDFLESDYEMLFVRLQRQLSQRSLLLLYTNFESLEGMRRQLRYLRGLTRRHLLVVIFFENTELHEVVRSRASTVEKIYIKTIAEQFAFEKRQIVKELQRYGIHAILTTPSQLSVNTINKYLQLKARGLI